MEIIVWWQEEEEVGRTGGVSGVAADPVAGNVVGESAKPDFYQEMGGRGALDGAAVANQWSWCQEGVLGAILSGCGHVGPTLGGASATSYGSVVTRRGDRTDRLGGHQKKKKTTWVGTTQSFGATTW